MFTFCHVLHVAKQKAKTLESAQYGLEIIFKLILKLSLFSCAFQAGEALGAIGSADVLDILREYANDPQTEVRVQYYV